MSKTWSVGIYARVSTDHDNQKLSNDHQIEAMKEWMKQQGKKEPMKLYDLYIDDGITGTKIKKRYDFQRMIKDAKDGLINFIIVKSVTRFARNQIDSIKLAQDLKDKGVRIYFHQEQVDTFDNAQMLGLWAWLAENESRTTSDRRKGGGREAQKKGRFTTNRPPIGYKSVNGYLKINKDEESIILKIFDYFLQGFGYGKIAATLNEQGYRTRRGYVFRSDKIKYILKNETYKGTFIGNRYTKVDMLSDKIIEKPREEWIIIEDNHEAIIPPDKFDRVQSLIKDKSFTIGKRSTSLFAGIIKCGKCNHGFNYTYSTKYRGGKDKKYSYYKCAGKAQKGKNFCDAHSIKESEIIDAVQEELSYLKEHTEIIEDIHRKSLNEINARLKNIDGELVDINSKIEEINEQRKKLAKKNIMEIIDDDLFQELDKDLKEQLKTFTQRKNKTRLVDSKAIFEENFKQFVSTLSKFDDVRKMNNIEMRRLIDSIIVYDDTIDINIKINKNDFNIKEAEGLNSIPIVSTIHTKFQLLISKNTHQQIHISRKIA